MPTELDSTPVPSTLSTAQRQQFHNDGYLVLKGLLTSEQITDAKRYILDLLPRDLVIPPAWYSIGGRIKPFHAGYGDFERPGHEDTGIYDPPELLPLLCNEGLYTVAAELLGSTRIRAMDGTIGITIRNDDGPALTQTIHVDATVPSDCDNFLFTPEELQVGGCFYLTDVEHNGGGIHIIPGGHRLVEEKAKASPSGRQLYKVWRNVDDFPSSVEVTGNAGDFVLMHHLMPHAASANRNPNPRLAYFVRYIREDHPHYPSQPAPPNRYNTRQLRAMTELGRKVLGVDPW